MTKQSQRADVNNFIGGLHTEASVLNFPANASADEVNFELNRDGSRNRRFGMDYEAGYNYAPTGYLATDISTLAFNTFRWTSAAGNPDVNVVVFQVGNKLWFYNLDVSSVTGPPPLANITVDQFPTTVRYSFASVEGMLVFVSGAENIALVEYVNGAFNLSYERLLIRDLWGIEEVESPQADVDPAFRPLLNNTHAYNLMNQSWGIPRKGQDGNLWNPITYFYAALPDGSPQPNPNPNFITPSNAESVFTGLQMQPVSLGQQPFERMFRNLYDDSLGAKVQTAKGYFVIDALRRGTGRQDALIENGNKYPQMVSALAFKADFSPFGASCVSEFAGRIFYSGFGGEVIDGDARSPTLANYVFFSQAVKNKLDINRCYQEGDPTSRESSDVVDTDGGFVRVSGAQNILAMTPLGISMVVIAENGVWALTGGTTDSGFSATNYKVNKLSSFGAMSASSVVTEGDVCYFWANDGIYRIGKDQFGDLQVTNTTLTTIQKLYQKIPNDAKAAAFGAYDEVNKKIRWVYKTGTLLTNSQQTMELIFDSTINAYTQNSIANSKNNLTCLAGIFQTQLFIVNQEANTIFVDSDVVLVDSDTVLMSNSKSIASTQFLRYLVMVNLSGQLNIVAGWYNNEQWMDWVTLDGGTDAKAFCLTGASTAGDSAVDKQVPYLVMHFNRTEDGVDGNLVPTHGSSCLMRTQWNFASAVESNKWSPLAQAYRYRKVRYSESLSDTYNTGFDVITTKNKIRGKGRAFALYFETEAGKDCQILGWNITVNGNSTT